MSYRFDRQRQGGSIDLSDCRRVRHYRLRRQLRVRECDVAGGDADDLDGGAEDDYVDGGTGHDNVRGGSGDDIVRGGANDDVVRGDMGIDQLFGDPGVDHLFGDTLYGDVGIDMLYLDTSFAYSVIPVSQHEKFDGHFGNVAPSDTPDDNATDILLIEGTDLADSIYLGQVGYALPGNRTGTRLAIDVNGRFLTADWRDFFDTTDANGRPLVEQFRISGLGNDDTIQFVATNGFVTPSTNVIDRLDVADLDDRSDDWIGVIDGGPGNDTLSGTGARDRIDGGFGSDFIYGFGGDDQLWGDGGPGLGDPANVDTIYGGQGNDDLLGGVGRNFLYAWSFDPRADLDGDTVTQFGILVDNQGNFYDDDGGGLYQLEDTGLNRVLGSANLNPLFGHDDLYGGSGLDFLYGNGAPANDPDRLFDRHGNLFEARDGTLAGDEWKEYAKSTDKVWYYGGSNLNDVITVDFVTEPGVLQGHHLITRLTENNGNFTFDAQVRLDFKATDADGRLIWSPDDSYYGLALTSTVGGRSNGRMLDATDQPLADAVVLLAVDGLVTSVTLPTNLTLDNRSVRDLAIDWNTTLQAAGVGAALSARPNGDRISFVRAGSQVATNGSLIIVSANTTAQSYFGFTAGLEATIGFVGSNGLMSLLPGEGDFLAIIIDGLDGNDQITVGPTVTKSVWTDGGRGNDTILYVSGKPILIDQTDSRSNGIGNGDQAHAYNFGDVFGNTLVTGLTIDSPMDQDWYKFRLTSVPTASEQIRIRSISSNDRMTVRLVDAAGTELASTVGGVFNLASLGLISGVDYFLHVKTDLIPTAYEIEFVTGAAANTTKVAATNVGNSIDGYASILGRALRTGPDQAWYKFQLSRDAIVGDDLVMNVFEAAGAVTLTLVDALGERIAVSGIGSDSVSLSLKGLKTGTDYWFKISGDGPARYEIVPRMGGTDQIDLSSVTVINKADPTIIARRDVILGGEGNDTIQGGPGEDWIFGGTDNDVLSGGFDRQHGDLIWGGAGDDIYQILPDAPALTSAGQRSITAAGQTTYIPTYSDRFDGGEGTDQVLFLGGDLDAQNDPINDNVAIRWNTLLHRYEFTSRVWDVVHNDFVSQLYPAAAVYQAGAADFTVPGLSIGQLSGDATFDINVNGTNKTITITQASTKLNGQFDQLVAQINAAFAKEGLANAVVAEIRSGLLAFSTIRISANATLAISVPNTPTGIVAGKMGIKATTATLSGSNSQPGFAQYYANYTTTRTEATLLDLRAGNDEVHADPEYLIRGSEWGIDPEDRPQRANPNLIIRGGAGSDRLFGGDGDDVIEGGDGADVVIGGGGSDDLSGNSGDDWISGGTPTLVPDRYETSAGRTNEIVGYASLLTDSLLPLRSIQKSDVVISDLSLHYGDRGDWYVVRTPEAIRSFGSAKAAQVLRGMIDLRFMSQEAQTAGTPVRNVLSQFGFQSTDTNNPDRTLFLFAAADTDPGSVVSPVPIDQFPGLPDYYMIHIPNVNSMAIVASAPSTTAAEYKLTGGGSITFQLDGVTNTGANPSVSIVVNLTEDVTRVSFAQTIAHIRTQVLAKQVVFNGSPVLLSDLIYVDQVSVQDQRVGFWLKNRDATTLKITGVTGAASTRLHLENSEVNRSDASVGRPPEAVGPYTLTLKADSIAVGGASGSALYFTATDATLGSGALWRVSRIADSVETNRVSLSENGQIAGQFNSLTDVNGTLFAARGITLRSIAVGQTQATSRALSNWISATSHMVILLAWNTQSTFAASTYREPA